MKNRKPDFMEKMENWIGEYWEYLIQMHPHWYIQYCDFNNMTGADWGQLLSIQPRLIQYCNFDELHGGNWQYILIHQPQLASFCEWDKLKKTDWFLLLNHHPSIIRDFPEAWKWYTLCQI